MGTHGGDESVEGRQGGGDLHLIGGVEVRERLGEQGQALVAPAGELACGGRGEVEADAAPVGGVAAAFEQSGSFEVARQSAHRVGGEPQVSGGFPGPHAGVAAYQVEQLDVRAGQSGHPDRTGEDPAAHDPERPEQALCLVGQLGGVLVAAAFG
jgi:hypothetical protein